MEAKKLKLFYCPEPLHSGSFFSPKTADVRCNKSVVEDISISDNGRRDLLGSPTAVGENRADP